MPFVLTLYAQQVLGYSAVEFGLTLDRVPGRGHGRARSRAGAGRPGSACGRSPPRAWRCSASAACISRRSRPDGSYFGDIFLGLLISGPGVGLTFVTCSIAALAGVDGARGRPGLRAEQHDVPDRRRDRDRDRLDGRVLARGRRSGAWSRSPRASRRLRRLHRARRRRAGVRAAARAARRAAGRWSRCPSRWPKQEHFYLSGGAVRDRTGAVGAGHASAGRGLSRSSS